MNISHRSVRHLVGIVLFAFSMAAGLPAAKSASLIEAGQPKSVVVLDAGVLTTAQQKDLTTVRDWFVEALQSASGATLPVADKLPEANAAAVVLTTAQQQPELAAKAGLKGGRADGFAIVTNGPRVYLIGSNPSSIRLAVAHLLRELGFRFYAPSERWHIVPALKDVRVDLNMTQAPDVGSRTIWYAYGNPIGDLMEDYHKWVFGNRLTSNSLTSTGHSYGNIIGRNKAEFDAHPEYFALLENGERDTKRAIAARKFCFSNPGLVDLVAKDRIKLLEEQRKLNPLEYMVSVDPSDGEGTCHCPVCAKLGTTSDRVFYLANQVAKRLRAVYPDAWVGLYAYSSHRLPPTIELEPNVYVQIAMGFNRTQYTLPELVELWSKKASAIGLREYYGVEAWDWGLPGRMRGSKVDYHQKWIPYYAKRKLTSINAETNSNWAGQMLGLYIASELMWDTEADVDKLVNRFFTDNFGPAAAPMKAAFEKFDSGAQLTPALLSPMFENVQQAYGLTQDAKMRARINDIMAYLLYVDDYRRFELIQDSQPGRNDVYYDALKPLMNYAWRIRERDMVHYYALARRLTNGLPIQDKRPEFHLSNKEAPPVWMNGEAISDEEILAQFRERNEALKKDKSPYATYSRYLERVNPPGADAGMTRAQGEDAEGVGFFRNKTVGYLVPGGQQRITLGIKAATKPVTFKVFLRGDDVLTEQTVSNTQGFEPVPIDLPKAGEYRFEMQGQAALQVPPDAPVAIEASSSNPAWIDGSGPYYFYVPRGVKQVFLDGNPRLSIYIPGVKARRDITPADRVAGQAFSSIDVPAGADGQVWRTDAQTRGQVAFLNIPQLLSANRKLVLIPREVSEADSLTTAP
jgi:hypothetical protein